MRAQAKLQYTRKRHIYVGFCNFNASRDYEDNDSRTQ